MKAEVLWDLQPEEKKILLKDDKAHHLATVSRLQLNEKILLMDGRGGIYECLPRVIEKKKIELECLQYTLAPKWPIRNAFIGQTKKDAAEKMITLAVELGLSRLVFIESDYCQKMMMKEARMMSLIESAMKQSNNPWPPKIEFSATLEHFVNDKHIKIVFTPGIESTKWSCQEIKKGVSFCIGPEGGFSPDELDYLRAHISHFASFPTPILRAPNALCFSVGILSAQDLDHS